MRNRSSTLRRAREDRPDPDAWSARDTGPAGRQTVAYACSGHEFAVPFAADADVPAEWQCRRHGTNAPIVDRTLAAPSPSASHQPRRCNQFQAPRTPWVMLTERRTYDDLEALLEERLAELRAARRRGASVLTATMWLNQKQGRSPRSEPREPLPDGRYLPF